MSKEGAGEGSTSRGRLDPLASRLATGGMGVVILALLGFSAVLSSQNQRLKQELGALSARLGSAFDVGRVLPDVALVDDQGRRQTLVSLTQTPAVIAFVTTQCALCLDSVPTWAELGERAPSETRVVAVSLDSMEATRVWAARRARGLEVWYPATPADRSRLPLAAVPLTVVAREGKVQLALSGSLGARDVIEPILRLLHVD